MKIIAIAVTLASALVNLYAAETNIVQTITLNGHILTQNTPVTNGSVVTMSYSKTPFTTSNAIQALGVATQNTFSPDAQLRLITPAFAGTSKIVVQDGASRVNVTSYFGLSSKVRMEKNKEDAVKGTVTGISFDVFEFELSNGDFEDVPLEFEATGLLLAKHKTITVEGQPVVVDTLKGRLLGAGEYAQTSEPFIITLLLSVNGDTVEIIP